MSSVLIEADRVRTKQRAGRRRVVRLTPPSMASAAARDEQVEAALLTGRYHADAEPGANVISDLMAWRPFMV